MNAALAIWFLLPAPAPSVVGTWRLISRETTVNGTRVASALGTEPVGYLIYDGTGHMAVQVMRPKRSVSELEHCGSERTFEKNNAATVCGYHAYFGRYSIDSTHHTVTHHIEGALAPEDLGKDVQRSFEIDGDRLIISFATTVSDKAAMRRLVWRRVAPQRGPLDATWRLLSRETLVQGAPVDEPSLGAHPVGYLIYDAGRVAVQLMRRDRTATEMKDCGSQQARGKNNSAIFCGYDAYFGTYRIDSSQKEVTHHFEGALGPDDVGKEVRRSVAVDGDRLIITFATTAKDAPAIRKVVWERVR